MEAIARQLATGRKCLVIRNGWFSYRWSQIFEMGAIPAETIVLKAQPVRAGAKAAYAPPAIETVIDTIRREKPELVFAPHVETASGIILPDDYLFQVADAVHEAGGLFVLDCVASGAIWVDMQALGVDVLLTSQWPQGVDKYGIKIVRTACLNQYDDFKIRKFIVNLKCLVNGETNW